MAVICNRSTVEMIIAAAAAIQAHASMESISESALMDHKLWAGGDQINLLLLLLL